MFEREKSVDLSVFGYDKPAVVKRLTAGEKKDLDNALTKANSIRMRGQEVSGDLAPGESTLVAAMAYYKEGPIPKERAEFEKVDWEVVALLAQAGEELNSPLELYKDKEP